MFALRSGDLLARKYRVERVLGAGSMGLVVSAIHVHLRQRVAVKVLLPDMAAREDVVARFLREGRTVTTIDSEHVAGVLDVGVLDDGVPYLVMEYLQGTTLGALVRDGGPVDWPVAVSYGLQICDALAAAHAAGIVHRDLKASNVMVTVRADGSACVKVLDFGISKIEGEEMTRTGSAILGSPSYMSPEQMMSLKHVDARADIWSFGVVLYEMLAGRRPFVAESMPLLCEAVLRSEPAPIREGRPDVPQALEAVVMRCLRKQKDERFADVEALAAALRPFVETPLGPGPASGAARRSRRRAMAIASGALLIAVLGGAYVTRSARARAHPQNEIAAANPPDPPATALDSTATVDSGTPGASAGAAVASPTALTSRTSSTPTWRTPPPPARRVERHPSPRVNANANANANAPTGSAGGLFEDRKW